MLCERDIQTTRGLTLLEVCIVLVLFVIIIAVGAPNLRSSKASTESMSAANVLAEELRNARQKAMASQIPVGVIFPTDNGVKSHTQSFYVMEGETNPKITKSVDLSKQYKSTYIFNGYWELDTSKLSDPTKINTTKQPTTGSKYDNFDVNAWGPQAGDPKANDMAYVFTPAGTVRSNGLLLFDGDFHVLVTGAVAYEPGSVLPSAMNDDGFLPCFLDLSSQVFAKLTKVFDPYTITITPLGKITVEKGVKALLESSGENTPQPFDVPPPAPPQSVPPGGANNAPKIESVTFNPAPNPETLPAGVDATVRAEDMLTITVKATDADGDPLYCKWKAKANAGGQSGSFSSANGEDRMEWSYSEKKWNSVTEWKPPTGAIPGDRFTLTCTVNDIKGGKDKKEVVVQILEEGKILLYSQLDPWNRKQLYVVNTAGSGLKRLIGTENNPGFIDDDEKIELYPVYSPDGSQIIFVSSRDNNRQICIMNSDGTGARNLSNSLTSDYHLLFRLSPDGTKIVFKYYRGIYDAGDLFIANIDWTNPDTGERNSPKNITNNPTLVHRSFVWSPDSTRVAYSKASSGYYNGKYQSRYELDVATVYGSQPPMNLLTLYSSVGGGAGSPQWEPSVMKSDGSMTESTKILFFLNRITDKGLFMANTDGSGGLTKIADGVFGGHQWSPDGKKIALSCVAGVGGDIWVMNPDGSNLVNLTNSDTYEGNPHWSPDSKKIYFGVGWPTYDAQIMSDDGVQKRDFTSIIEMEKITSWKR